MSQRFVLLIALTSLIGLRPGKVLADATTTEVFYSATRNFGLNTEFVRNEKTFLGSITVNGDAELGVGYTFLVDGKDVQITTSNGPRGIRPRQLYITPLIIARGDHNDPSSLDLRVRFQWMVDNRQDFSEARYNPVLLEMEPSTTFQRNQPTVHHVVSRLTMFSSKMSSRFIGFEHVFDFYPPLEVTTNSFRDPEAQTFRQVERPRARLLWREYWMAGWNVPYGFIQFSFNKGALVSAMNSSPKPGAAPIHIDWQIKFVYRRYQ